MFFVAFVVRYLDLIFRFNLESSAAASMAGATAAGVGAGGGTAFLDFGAG